ncbi:MAG: peptide chain release factor 3, partial [Gammaproteobacteria bacterium]|nr:peptide chain release factor 3 [Gammaproteobacteria bacterium]
GEAKLNRDDEERIEGVDNPRLDELFPGEVDTFREEVELIREASAPLDPELFLAGMQTPVFFGSALNNFGVEDVLNALNEWAPPPQSRAANERVVEPVEDKLTGFVFKIQANMDPKHRDRLAFFRICSGRYNPGKRLRHLRLDREIRINNALVFMANERVRSEDAVAGDIIGIHNHGQLQIGDTLTEGEDLNYKGIPYFAPELFLSVRPRDPFKTKQLTKGLRELGEEGAIQVLTTDTGRLLLGAVGQLQFEIVGHRLREEYSADPVYEPVDIFTARWLSFPDEETRKGFLAREQARMGTDVDGNPVYLATNLYNLRIAEERWPDVTFHKTREHGEVLTD